MVHSQDRRPKARRALAPSVREHRPPGARPAHEPQPGGHRATYPPAEFRDARDGAAVCGGELQVLQESVGGV